MGKLNSDSEPTPTPLEVPEASATTPTDKPQDSLGQIGSTWGQNALKSIKEMHQNEEARKKVARRLF